MNDFPFDTEEELFEEELFEDTLSFWHELDREFHEIFGNGGDE